MTLLRVFLAFAALLVSNVVFAVTPRIVQCEACSTVSQFSEIATSYGTGDRYVFSLANNKFRRFLVRYQAGQYIAEPSTPTTDAQLGFDALRRVYVIDPLFMTKNLVIYGDIGDIPGGHNPIIIARDFPGRSGFNSFILDFNSFLNNSANLTAMDPRLADIVEANWRWNGITGGVLGAAVGLAVERAGRPNVDLYMCDSNQDCAVFELAPGGTWGFQGSRAENGEGDNYPSPALCGHTGACDYNFTWAEAYNFRDALINAGIGLPNSITQKLRCAFVNGELDYCMWIATTNH